MILYILWFYFLLSALHRKQTIIKKLRNQGNLEYITHRTWVGLTRINFTHMTNYRNVIKD